MQKCLNKCYSFAVLRSASQSKLVKGAALMAISSQSFPSKAGVSCSLITYSKGTPLEPYAIVSAAMMASLHASHPAEFFNGGSILRVDIPSAVFFLDLGGSVLAAELVLFRQCIPLV